MSSLARSVHYNSTWQKSFQWFYVWTSISFVKHALRIWKIINALLADKSLIPNVFRWIKLFSLFWKEKDKISNNRINLKVKFEKFQMFLTKTTSSKRKNKIYSQKLKNIIIKILLIRSSSKKRSYQKYDNLTFVKT